MGTNWFDQLILFGALQGFVLVCVIWKKRAENKIVLDFLGALVFLTSVILIGRLFFLTTYLNKFWFVYTYADIIIFLFGPIIYFFTTSLLGKELPRWSRLKWHFLPALIHLLIFNTILSLAALELITGLKQLHYILIYSFLEISAIISLGIYLWKSINVYHQFELEHYNNQSSPLLTSFLKPFLYFLSVLTILWCSAFLLKYIDLGPGDEGVVYYGFWTLTAVSTYFLSYKILLNPEVLSIQTLTTGQHSVEYQKPLETNSETLLLKSKLKELLDHTDIYQNPKLSLDDLAQAMAINRHELSKIINQGFGKNFFDLINSYRIQAFVKYYQEEPNSTFLEIAYQVGFNSKSAFNRAFRKEKGSSPSQYFKTRPSLQQQ